MRIRDLPDFEARRAAVMPAVRATRFKHAKARIRAIVAGTPKLTDDEFRFLAALLMPSTSEDGGGRE